MNEALSSQAMPTKRRQLSPMMKRFTNYGLLALAFFLLGFLPLWISAHEAAQRHAETARELRLVQLQTDLGSAVIDAQRGAHEPALEAVSRFFTSLQVEIDSGEASDFSLTQREALPLLLDGRDELIALLARGDPAGATRLSALYQSFSQILTGQAVRGIEAGAQGGREMALARRAP